MKKRLFVFTLSLALCLGFSPALATETEDISFNDVPADSWFAPYVDYVAKDGIMIGTGDGAFSPDKELTRAECLTLAVRLYDLRHGGDGVLKEAPEDWGLATLTTEDGASISAYGDGWVNYTYPITGKSFQSDFSLLLDTEERLAWAKAHDGQAATLSVEGQSCSGFLTYTTAQTGLELLRFRYNAAQTDNKASNIDTNAVRHDRPLPGVWYRNSYYTAELLGLNKMMVFHNLEGVERAGEMASREEFAKALYVASGELEKINEIEAIPDLTREDSFWEHANDDIYALYEAGILNGVDETGAFAPYKTLTRAEAAAMVARVLEPALRMEFTLPSQPQRNYTLTPFDLGEWEIYDGYNCVAADWIAVTRGTGENKEFSILRLDGSAADLQGGAVYTGEAPGSQGDTRYALVVNLTREGAESLRMGVYDVTAGTFVIPYQQEEDAWEGYTRLQQTEQRAATPIPQNVLDALGFPYGTGDAPLRDWNGEILCLEGEGLYMDYDLIPMTEKFDWAGPLNGDGTGFVSKNGEIYRIDFANWEKTL